MRRKSLHARKTQELLGANRGDYYCCSLEEYEVDSELEEALNRLTDNQRTAVHLFYFEGYSTDELLWLRCEITARLSGCFDLHEDTELTGFSGNIEYMNKCRMITSHYAVDENGALNEGNSFVIVEYDLLNEGDEEVFIGTFVGALCAVDKQGAQTVFATSGVFGAIDAGWHDTANGDCALRGVWLKPDEANHVTVAFVAEDVVASAEKLALMVSPDESFLRYGYEGELPNVHDLQFVWLRS